MLVPFPSPPIAKGGDQGARGPIRRAAEGGPGPANHPTNAVSIDDFGMIVRVRHFRNWPGMDLQKPGIQRCLFAHYSSWDMGSMAPN